MARAEVFRAVNPKLKAEVSCESKELGRGLSSCFFVGCFFVAPGLFGLFCFVLFCFGCLVCLFVCLFVCFFVSLFLCFLIEYSTNSKSAVNGIFDELMILAPFFPSIVSKQNLRKFDPIIL